MSKIAAQNGKVALRLSDSPMITMTERERSFAEWNSTEIGYPKDKCIHELFQEQVERTPDSVAVVHEDQELTYRELDNRSNQLAHYLRELGVGPETLVSICLNRSLQLIVGLLGIIKAGGAYVPMDPSYPSERLAFMMKDTQAQVLLTNRLVCPKFRGSNTRTVYLASDWENINHQSTTATVNLTTPANLAYVIYTSGSTGKPKGVLVEHAGMVNLVSQHRRLYGTSEEMRISQTASAGFDSMGSEIWPAILSGATLCIAPNEVRFDPELLRNWLIDQRITIAFVTTIIAERLLALSWPEKNIALRVLRFGGERFRGKAGDRHYPFRVYNEYGPTEDTVWTTVAEVIGENTSSIGRPIANHRVYVLDRKQNPVPAGEIGELCIAGVGLARGYLNSPGLTAEKLIACRFSNFLTERLYRTGDLVRYLPNGDLEFLGRIDHQVKIRGFRIEPEEIEFVLSGHPNVRECIVIARENRLGDNQLMAYVVIDEKWDNESSKSLVGQRLDGSTRVVRGSLNRKLAPRLRNYLTGKLPDYMVPSTFVFFDSLPLTPNGKLDRSALPEQVLSGEQYVEPRTFLERKLAEIWQDVFDVERVGLEDNFLELGGNSLLAMRTVLQIERILGKRLSLATFFQAPTIERLTLELEMQGRGPVWSSLVAIQPHGSRPPFFGVHTLSGEVLFYRHLAECLGEDQPFFGLQSEGLDGGLIKHGSMEAIARNYVREIRRFQTHGPYYLGGYCIGGVVAFEMAQQLRAAGEEVGCLVLIEAYKPEPQLRLGTLRERIRLALDETRDISPNEKLRYFTRRVTGKMRWEIARLQNSVNDHIRPLYKALKQDGETSAVFVEPNRSPVGRMLIRAQSKYRPRAYPGRITLLRTALSEEDDTAEDRGWGDVAEGGVEIHYIAGEHQTVFEPKHAPALAKTLDSCLRRNSARARDARVGRDNP
jgi:amino acid adenylation domain-containing protein